MHVGVVIPAHNVAPWLTDAIWSVLRQSHRDWSVVVVDDGSTDDSAAIAAGFEDPRIRLIRQAKMGVSAARNRGAGTVKADAILFLDGDDWLAPDALAALSDTLEDSPWAVAAVGAYARVSTDGSMRRHRAPPSGSVLRQLLVRNLFANGGHILIRREAIDAAGGFNPALTYGEDWEYWTRLALLGEFVGSRTAEPLLFVRERAGSAYMTMAADPNHLTASLDAVFNNPGIEALFGRSVTRRLRQRAEAENAWVTGRELVRHGRLREGLNWLLQSIRQAPTIKRPFLLALSCLGLGPFRPYRNLGSPTFPRGPRAIPELRNVKFVTYHQFD